MIGGFGNSWSHPQGLGSNAWATGAIASPQVPWTTGASAPTADSNAWTPHTGGVKRPAASAFDNSGWPAQQDGGNTSWSSNASSWTQADSWNRGSTSYDNAWKHGSSNDHTWKEESTEVEDDVDVEARSHGVAFLQPVPPLSPSLQSAVMAAREVNEVAVKGETPGLTYPAITSFADLSSVLPGYVTASLAQAGITAPFPIQSHTLPFTLRGFDLIGIAKTGSGKTLAFLLPAIAHAEMQPPMPQDQCVPSAIVLAPVRELAVQIAEEAVKILWNSGSANHAKGIGCVSVYGGGGRLRYQQLAELKKGYGHIVVGTPGRVADFLQSGDLVLDRVVFFVLDEADRMLDGGFEDQINDIAGRVQPDRQTLFFSATWPAAVRKLAKNMCRAPPIRVSIGQGADDAQAGPTTRSDITQEIMVFDGGAKRPWPDEVQQQITDHKTATMNSSMRMWLANPINKVLVFVNTKTMAWEVAEQLKNEGFSADAMSSNLSQTARADVVKRFKEGELKLVVTTDVMARGLDIPNISHVLVYDCYGGIDDYVHRIGRTARGLNGQTGYALIFYEFDPKFAQMPGEIIALLQGAGQRVPPELQQIADEVASGVRKAVHGTQKKKQKKGW